MGTAPLPCDGRLADPAAQVDRPPTLGSTGRLGSAGIMERPAKDRGVKKPVPLQSTSHSIKLNIDSDAYKAIASDEKVMIKISCK